jgi:hypothetical protein
MQRSSSLPPVAEHVRRLRNYRLLANALAPLMAMALAVLVFRWMFPWLFSVVVSLWTVDIFLLVALAVPWLLLSWAFASGRIKCPACAAPFTGQFHLWVPKTCQHCAYDITASKV